MSNMTEENATRKEEIPKLFTKISGTLVLDVHDTLFINNIVDKVEGHAYLQKDALKGIYISDTRICISLEDGREYSFPIGKSDLHE